MVKKLESGYFWGEGIRKENEGTFWTIGGVLFIKRSVIYLSVPVCQN
jgi:hypothetical protein